MTGVNQMQMGSHSWAVTLRYMCHKKIDDWVILTTGYSNVKRNLKQWKFSHSYLIQNGCYQNSNIIKFSRTEIYLIIIPWFNSIRYDSLKTSSANIHSVPYGCFTDSIVAWLFNSLKHNILGLISGNNKYHLISENIFEMINSQNWICDQHCAFYNARISERTVMTNSSSTSIDQYIMTQYGDIKLGQHWLG